MVLADNPLSIRCSDLSGCQHRVLACEGPFRLSSCGISRRRQAAGLFLREDNGGHRPSQKSRRSPGQSAAEYRALRPWTRRRRSWSRSEPRRLGTTCLKHFSRSRCQPAHDAVRGSRWLQALAGGASAAVSVTALSRRTARRPAGSLPPVSDSSGSPPPTLRASSAGPRPASAAGRIRRRAPPRR
jgi:hypothetical protein